MFEVGVKHLEHVLELVFVVDELGTEEWKESFGYDYAAREF